jgi:hypothetical protein
LAKCVDGLALGTERKKSSSSSSKNKNEKFSRCPVLYAKVQFTILEMEDNTLPGIKTNILSGRINNKFNR